MLSDKQQAVLETGEEIVVIYHTPQMLRYVLGEKSGTFILRKAATDHRARCRVLRRYAELQRAIKAARERLMPAQKMPVEFGEWRPDMALLDTKFAAEVENVFAGVNSYLPFPSLQPFSHFAIARPPAGCIPRARRPANGKFTPAPRPSSIRAARPDGWTSAARSAAPIMCSRAIMWSFEQSGQQLIAVNVNDDPQVSDDRHRHQFEALAGRRRRPPTCKQMGDFLFLSGWRSGGSTSATLSGRPSTTSPDGSIGTNLCDMQEFPDGGPVQGVAGAEIGYVVQDRAIRTLQFLPGDTTLYFQFLARAARSRLVSRNTASTRIGNVLYFVAEDGFYSLTGQQVTPIGPTRSMSGSWPIPTLTGAMWCIASAGVNKPRVVWVYHASSASPDIDRQIIFDWSNGRWARASIAAEVWAMLASLGLDLDTDGPESRRC